MRFESVTARAFGPHRDETLRFGRHMTVVHGPNEAGKSTWHAALYVGLCGMRRAKGKQKQDARFSELHRPWEGDRWQVTVTMALDDGRRIELRQELEGKVDCRATDLALGRDVSGEIINEGAPDGSRWLGLDRRSFFATACVRQAEIRSVLDDPEQLQEHLQRAAATAGRDTTAARAIDRVEEYQREHVGRNFAHSTKPLRAAFVRVERARARLENVKREHRDYVELVQRAQGLKEQAEREIRLLEAARAAQAIRTAESTAGRLERARALAARHPEGPPPLLEDDQALAADVAGALREWSTRPQSPELTGPDSTELRDRIGGLPARPAGDTRPDPRVVNAAREHEMAEHSLALHRNQRPPRPPELHSGGASPEELRTLAQELRTVVPPLDPELQERHGRAQRRLDELQRRRGMLKLVGAGAALLVAAGAVLWRSGRPIPAAVVAAVGAVGFLLVLTRWGAAARAGVLTELRKLEWALGEQGHAAREAERRLSAARERALALGVPADAEAVWRLAIALETAARLRLELGRWSEQNLRLEEAASAARGRLAAALKERGAEVVNEHVQAAFVAYRAACDERARLAELAAIRRNLESQLEKREQLERIAREVELARTAAERAIQDVARRCGLHGTDPDELVPALDGWQGERAAALGGHEQAVTEWAELQALLEGATLEELESRVEHLRRHAAALVSSLEAPPTIELAEDVEAQLARLQRAADEAVSRAAQERGRVEDRTLHLASVAEAEEELAEAEAELERVQRLGETLATTLGFLRNAQERVHRDIAPVLAGSVQRWLPEVTAGRYVNVLVEPATLKVQVCGRDGVWREASLLSHGTAEQIYLLLRIAMATHLATTGESCPLVLDEVTVQCDRERTQALLQVLHTVSRERQLILFTQEEDVLEWAEANLREEAGDLLVRLEAAAAVA